MPESKWSSFISVSPEGEYLAMAVYLHLDVSWLSLKPLWLIPRFMGYTRSIQRQLSGARGLVGYSLRGELLRPRFWTLSVWEDEDTLMEFARRAPHGE